MEAFVVVALVALGLLLAELALPTGGALAALGAVGLIASGVIALEGDSSAADVAGPALIAFGVLAAIALAIVARKVLIAQRDTPVRAGTEEMVGAAGEARSAIAPTGQVWMRGTLWGARLAPGAGPVGLGDRVKVEAVDGLTLVVRPDPEAAEQPSEGAS